MQLVAEVDGEPIGSAILTPYGDGEIKLSKLFLKPEFRGLGLGREMLERSEDEARAARLPPDQPGHARALRRGGAALRARRVDARPRPAASRARTGYYYRDL